MGIGGSTGILGTGEAALRGADRERDGFKDFGRKFRERIVHGTHDEFAIRGVELEPAIGGLHEVAHADHEVVQRGVPAGLRCIAPGGCRAGDSR